VVAIVIAVVVTRGLITDGKVTWMEGVLLLATYAIFAFAFYHIPDGGGDLVLQAVESPSGR
jgi:Ca2+:H+ antiporter